jgi:hypothetical protein
LGQIFECGVGGPVGWRRRVREEARGHVRDIMFLREVEKLFFNSAVNFKRQEMM